MTESDLRANEDMTYNRNTQSAMNQKERVTNPEGERMYVRRERYDLMLHKNVRPSSLVKIKEWEVQTNCPVVQSARGFKRSSSAVILQRSLVPGYPQHQVGSRVGGTLAKAARTTHLQLALTQAPMRGRSYAQPGY